MGINATAILVTLAEISVVNIAFAATTKPTVKQVNSLSQHGVQEAFSFVSNCYIGFGIFDNNRGKIEFGKGRRAVRESVPISRFSLLLSVALIRNMSREQDSEQDKVTRARH